MSTDDFRKNGTESCVMECGRPLLESPAFQRLKHISFLGALSHTHAKRLDCPHQLVTEFAVDGSRASHSIGVASIALEWAIEQEISFRVQRLLLAWGLLHDIGTWPMSHTSEAAFSKLTGISTRELRAKVILGNRMVPNEFHVGNALKEMAVIPEELVAFFLKTEAPADSETKACWKWIHSVINPDTLEGIARSATAFKCSQPPPYQEVIYHLKISSEEPLVHRDGVAVVSKFWEAKKNVYANFINRPEIVRWESMLATAIEKAWPEMTLERSLYLNESDILCKLQGENNLYSLSDRHFRYKLPQLHLINNGKLEKICSSGNEWLFLSDLNATFYSI